MPYTPIEDTPVYALACATADEIWDFVATWSILQQRTVGEQLVRAVDSIAANLVEGDGRGSDPDAMRFFIYSRASAREARHWLRTASRRGFIKPDQASRIELQLVQVAKGVSGLISYRRNAVRKGDTVKETIYAYSAEDPLLPDS